jgi:predicted NBD/HSP70 family sugar kinase
VIDEAVDATLPPAQTLSYRASSTDMMLGVNVGGRYARLVWLQGWRIVAERSVDLEQSDYRRHVRGSVRDLTEFFRRHDESKDLACIGIAWSAPRTALGLRAMSLQMRRLGEAAELLQAGTLDETIATICGCEVYSWNDGEAVAAAEATWRARLGRPMLVLKLGTSFASGIATGKAVSLLPMQLAKCLLSTQPIRAYRHPSVGLRGTARDLLGAEPIEATYRELTENDAATYDDFCADVGRGEPLADEILARAATALAELGGIIERTWFAVDIVPTGRNVRDSLVRLRFYDHLAKALKARNVKSRLSPPVCDVDLSAAIGAAVLTYSRTIG